MSDELKKLIKTLLVGLRVLLNVELKTDKPMDDGDRNELLELADMIEEKLSEEEGEKSNA